MSTNDYVLAMYDIRAKQEFIFRTNQIKEIIGGSLIIRDCFDDYLYPQAKKVGEGKGIYHGNESFTKAGFEEHIEEGYIGELIYDGGGNFIVLYKDVETYRKITYLFTKEVMIKIGTLRVLSSHIKGVSFDNYKADSKKLYAQHSVNENRESNVSPWASLPIVQVDRKTSQPLISEDKTKETKAKLDKYNSKKDKGDTYTEKEIDKLVSKKGEDSLLAIVYIDGNNMGAQVQKCIEDMETYEECISALRKFSEKIQKNYIDDRKDNIKQMLGIQSNIDKWRLVVGAGDEINFICNAHDAYKLAKSYLESLPNGCSSCAGIAIFNSHAPYSDIYRIAEECCESGKNLMKKKKIKEGCFIDFHYCQGAIDISLEKIRTSEGTEEMSRPWYVPKEDIDIVIDRDIVTTVKVENMVKSLRLLGRSNVKGLAEKAKNSLSALKLDLERINAHMKVEEREALKSSGLDISNISAKEQLLIYDIVIAYDLWFAKED